MKVWKKQTKQYLKNGKQVSKSIVESKAKTTKTTKAVLYKTKTLNDLNATEVHSTLNEWNNLGISTGTCNQYVRAVKCFSGWLLRERYQTAVISQKGMCIQQKHNGLRDIRRLR